jgi:ATP-dependent exoDNAse (exonuclease V) beta subunit
MGLGMDGEEILKTFYETVPYEKRGEGWVTPYKAERWRGVKPEFDLIDADTGEVVAQAGQKISARAAKKLIESGTPAAEIAVLYRINAQSEVYEEALTAAGIAFQVRGGEGFFSRQEIRQALVALPRAADRSRRDNG